MQRNRVLLLLAAPDDAVTPQLRDALSREAKAALGRVTIDGAAYRVAARVPPSGSSMPSSYDLILERGLANGVMLGGFSAVLEVSCPAPDGLDELARCVDGVGGRLEGLIDRSRSCAVVGTDLVLLDGGGPVQLFYCMRRSPDATHEAFSKFWAKQHAEIAVTTPSLAGYRQLHASLDHSRVASEAAGLPGDRDQRRRARMVQGDGRVRQRGRRTRHLHTGREGIGAEVQQPRWRDLHHRLGVRPQQWHGRCPVVSERAR